MNHIFHPSDVLSLISLTHPCYPQTRNLILTATLWTIWLARKFSFIAKQSYNPISGALRKTQQINNFLFN